MWHTSSMPITPMLFARVITWLVVDRKLTTDWHILIWMTRAEAPYALQDSRRNALLGPSERELEEVRPTLSMKPHTLKPPMFSVLMWYIRFIGAFIPPHDGNHAGRWW